MKRRTVIASFGTAFALQAFPLRASEHRPRIAVLALNASETDRAFLNAFTEELARLGYVEGKSVDVDYRYADGETSVLKSLAAELAARQPNIVLADAPSAAIAINAVAPKLPVVCPAISDAIIPSLAANYAHPGGSVTGIGVSVEGLTAKLVELALEMLPRATHLGFLANPAGASMTLFEEQIEAAARARAVTMTIVSARSADDLDHAIRELADRQVEAFISPANAMLQVNRKYVGELAIRYHLPGVFTARVYVEAGGLLSYGVDNVENFRQVAGYVDKIIKGAAPGDLPIEFPAKLDLSVNLKTAAALGVVIPESILLRADEVIE